EDEMLADVVIAADGVNSIGLYTVKEGESEISFDYAGCLECGTCRAVCPKKGAIDWRYPRGGFGINYRYG
ncbi:MAG TPA: hypothetical protein PK728_02920, partial [Bacillota bacterium]|nr:hypothetical protein [Bacillota bacterium]